MGTPKGFRFLNPVRYADGVAYIQLGKMLREGADEAIVDTADVDRVIQFARWHRHSHSGPFTDYVRGAYGDGKRREGYVYLHRFILDAPSDLFVDHINGNGFDNRRANLRAVTHKQNMQNVTAPVRAKSGVRNVYLRKGKWSVVFQIGKERRQFGRFVSVGDAEAVAVAVRKQLKTHCPENSIPGLREAGIEEQERFFDALNAGHLDGCYIARSEGSAAQ